MKSEIDWLKGTLSAKDIVIEMSYYKIKDNEIRATDGQLIACHPWPHDGEALVPGGELEKILSKMEVDPEMKFTDKNILLKSGKFKASLTILPTETWVYPGIEDKDWKPIPENLLYVFKLLRPFVSTNATQPWAHTICLKNGWAYATNNRAVVGMPVSGLGKTNLLVPIWSLDFILKRPGITHWQFTDNYIAFKWETGAWVRSQLVVGEFSEVAFKLVKEASESNPTQEIADDFRMALARMNGLVENSVKIYATKLTGIFKEALVEEGIDKMEVPEMSDHSIWAPEFLAPVIEVATHWQPAKWPNPVPFKGEHLCGVVVGRVS